MHASMLSRRLFLQAMAAALAPVPAGALAADGTIHEILRRRVEVDKRAVGMGRVRLHPYRSGALPC